MRKYWMKVVIFGLLIAGCGEKMELSYKYEMPSGWTQNEESGYIASAWSPDQSAQVRISGYTVTNQTALEYLETRTKTVKYEKLIEEPKDMSRLNDRFKADSVAKAHFGMKNAKTRYSYRIFAFVKGSQLIVIEMMVAGDTEKIFEEASNVAESFQFEYKKATK